MEHRRCICCAAPAHAYRLEPDGTRIYLCLEHLPTWESVPPAKTDKPKDEPLP